MTRFEISCDEDITQEQAHRILVAFEEIIAREGLYLDASRAEFEDGHEIDTNGEEDEE